uniref:F-box domain-containing protein n=1 Tax=Anopheles minimus TaxID=112268 RepID=A0A182WED3_9DIPT
MNASECTNPFEELPPEILYLIFDFLDLNTLKSVSLTCHHLNHIFSSYSCGRHMLVINEVFDSFDNVYDSRVAIKSKAKLLQHSTRSYHKVYLPVHDPWLYPEHIMNSILYRVLQTDWSKQLVVLVLAIRNTSKRCGAMLTTAITGMDNLHELQFFQDVSLNPCNGWPQRLVLNDLKVENNTLQRLVLQNVIPVVINCPKLHKLNVASHLYAELMFGKQYAQYGDQEPYWKLKQLQEFTVMQQFTFWHRPDRTEHRPGYKGWLYQHLTKLKKLHLNTSGISENFLQIICKSCVLLEDLFICSLQAVDPNVLSRCLSNLAHLRRLGIWRMTTPQPVSFASVKTPQLEQLTLGMVDVAWESLEQVQSIKSLSLMPYFDNERLIPMSFAVHVKQIECLWLDLVRLRTHDPTDIFLLLRDLPQLSTLILEDMDDTWINLAKLPPLPQLKRLVLYRCRPIPDLKVDFLRFPNVERIELEAPARFANDFRQNLKLDDIMQRRK